MYNSILEYIVNADAFYRLWMVGELQHPLPADVKNHQDQNKIPISHSQSEWFPDLVDQFDDDLVPAGIRVAGATHRLDSDMRFHTGNKRPTIKADKMEMIWGDENMRDNPLREGGPAYIRLNGLQMWHHQDTLHRRRGDAVICEQATFQWNTKDRSKGAFREYGPYQVVIKNFRAIYNMGMSSDASYEHRSVSWGTESGIRLGESKVDEIITKNKLNVHYLKSDSIFESPMDEFIFWDEIGRAQDKR